MGISYFTVKPEGQTEIIIQKSRFIGYVKRVVSEEEAQNFVQRIKKKHYDATHNCSAYLIGENDQIQKANDDGEPGGTAGVPILEVIKRKQLKNTAIVVTRYFGGIKLGAGGLIRAYGSVAAEALKATGLVKMQLMRTCTVKTEYSLLGLLENALQNTPFILNHILYEDLVTLTILVEAGEEENFSEWLTALTHGASKMTPGESGFREIPVAFF